MSNFVKIRPVEAELFHAEGQTDRHDRPKCLLFAVLGTHLKKLDMMVVGWSKGKYYFFVNKAYLGKVDICVDKL